MFSPGNICIAADQVLAHLGIILVSEPHLSSAKKNQASTEPRHRRCVDVAWRLVGVSVSKGIEGYKYARYIGAGALRYGLGSLVRYKLRVWTAVDADVTQVLVSPYIVSLET